MAKTAIRTPKKTSRAKTKGATSIPVKAGATAPAAASTTAPGQDLEQIFENFLRRRLSAPFNWDRPRWGELWKQLAQQAPSVDIVDRDKEIVVRAELPGVEKKDLDVSVDERTLTIRGSNRREEKEEKDNYFRQEIRSGAFSRSVLLPADVNVAKAAATFKGGVLELHLPKARSAKPKKIDVG
jgi:HSP20 family protein